MGSARRDADRSWVRCDRVRGDAAVNPPGTIKCSDWAGRALRVLTRLEWTEGYEFCPECYRSKPLGHRSDCELNALLGDYQKVHRADV